MEISNYITTFSYRSILIIQTQSQNSLSNNTTAITPDFPSSLSMGNAVIIGVCTGIGALLILTILYYILRPKIANYLSFLRRNNQSNHSVLRLDKSTKPSMNDSISMRNIYADDFTSGRNWFRSSGIFSSMSFRNDTENSFNSASRFGLHQSGIQSTNNSISNSYILNRMESKSDDQMASSSYPSSGHTPFTDSIMNTSNHNDNNNEGWETKQERQSMYDETGAIDLEFCRPSMWAIPPDED